MGQNRRIKLIVAPIFDGFVLPQRAAVVRCVGMIPDRTADLRFDRLYQNIRPPQNRLKQRFHGRVCRCRIAAWRIAGIRPGPNGGIPRNFHLERIYFAGQYSHLPFLLCFWGVIFSRFSDVFYFSMGKIPQSGL